jgi:hypothetical protein
MLDEMLHRQAVRCALLPAEVTVGANQACMTIEAMMLFHQLKKYEVIANLCCGYHAKFPGGYSGNC